MLEDWLPAFSGGSAAGVPTLTDGHRVQQIIDAARRSSDGDGWVMSSLHARSGTRVYAKTISGGKADAGLSAEETDALRQALA